MSQDWHDNAPIYRQLRDRVVAMILEGGLKEGDALPSVRQVAADYRLNPLTVLKAYQLLADEDLVEKRRGLGLFVRPAAGERLLAAERAKFLEEQWPQILATIERLGLSAPELLSAAKPKQATPSLTKEG